MIKKIGWLALLFFIVAKSGQATTLFVESSLGFANTFRVNHWTPLSVIVENRGKLIEGTLEVVVRSGNEYQNNMAETSYQQPVELPANSRKKYQFVVLIPTSSHPLKINLHQQGRLIHSQSLRLQPLVSEKKIALLLGESGNWSFLNDIAQEMRPVFLRPSELPALWYGYDGATWVMLQSSVFKNLTGEQFQALVQWVENGGFLMVSGGLDYSFFANRLMENLAKIRVIGLEQTQQIEALQRFSGEPFVAKNPFLVLKAKVDGGRTLLQEGELPLVTEKPVGAGKVLFLAFDFQSSLFQGWRGNLNFWKWLNGFQPPENPSFTRLPESEILPRLMASLPPRFPSYYLILTLLVLYALVTFVFLNRLRNGTGKNLPFLAVTFFVFSGASGWLYAQSQAQSTHISRFTLLTKPARSPLAFAQQWTALRSFQPDSLQMEHPRQPVALLEAKYVKALAAERFVQKEEGEKRILGIPTRRWAHQYLASQFSLPLDLAGSFQEQKGGLRLVLENQTPFAIQEGVIYWAERLIPVGILPANKRKIIELTQAQVQAHGLLQKGKVRESAQVLAGHSGGSFLERFQQGVMEDLLRAVLNNVPLQKDRLLFMGWLAGQSVSSRHPTQKAPADEDQVTLIEWEIWSR